MGSSSGTYMYLCNLPRNVYMHTYSDRVLNDISGNRNKLLASGNIIIQDFRKYHYDFSHKCACSIGVDHTVNKLDCILKLRLFRCDTLFILHNWNEQQGETESLQRWLLHRQNVLSSYVLTWLILELVLFAYDRNKDPPFQVSPLEQFDLASFFLKSLQLFLIQLKIYLFYVSQMLLPLSKRVIPLNFLRMVVRKVSMFFCLVPSYPPHIKI